VAEYRPKIEAIGDKLHDILPAQVLALLKARQGELEADGIPERLAYRVASLGVMSAALDIVRIARGGPAVEDVACVYFGLGARFGLDRLRAAGASITVDTPWQKAAVTAVLDDLFNYQSALASRVMAESNGAKDPVEAWLTARPRVVERVDQTMGDLQRGTQSVDLAMLTVASRQLRALVDS
jgi:glutamate dehydrogenase